MCASDKEIEAVLSDSVSAIAGPELCVVLPTFNERLNILEVASRIAKVLGDTRWELIFVDDDSPDGTASAVREIARNDNRIRCIQRIGRRGLSSACIEGMLSSSAPYLAVMDSDLQHDETLLVDMLAELRESADTDIVVASRYVAGGGIGEWSNDRAAMSRLATKLSRLTLRANLSDPMSGMFMLRREVLERCVRNLSGIGFKILVDIFASSPQSLNFKELPYEFRARQAGESKLDNQAIWDYVLLLLDKSIGHIVPIRFVSFTLIGTFGLLIHFAVLSMLLGSVAGFMVAQSVATGVAIVANYTLNNELTYRDMRLRGYGWLKGLLSFSIACSVGAVANVGMATFLFESDTRWMLAALAGVLVGAVWNYSVTMFYTWKRPQAA